MLAVLPWSLTPGSHVVEHMERGEMVITSRDDLLLTRLGRRVYSMQAFGADRQEGNRPTFSV